jgi:hypothetical protein
MVNKSYNVYVNTSSPLSAKPVSQEKKQSIIKGMRSADISISKLVEWVSPPKSFAWSPSSFSGIPSNDTWYRQDAIALDFDNKGVIILEEQIISKCQELELIPNLIYETLGSSSGLPKYRLVFLLDIPFTLVDGEVRDKVVNTLHDIFPADRSCANRSSIFWGAKHEVRVLSNTPNIKDEFVEKVLCWGMYKDKNRTRLLDGLASEGRRGGTHGEIPNFYNNTNNRSSDFSPNINKKLPEKKSRWSIDEARDRIKAFDRFISGEKLLHNELMMVATNLYWQEGGEKIWYQVFKDYEHVYDKSKINIFKYCKKFRYPPIWISTNSCSMEDSGLHQTFADLLSRERGKITVKQRNELIPLDKAEKTLRDTFNDIMNSGSDDKVHLIICPTGVGKTEVIKDSKATIALPTHGLKSELSQRMKSSHICTPEEIFFKSNELNIRVKRYYSMGLHSKASEIIHEVANGNLDMDITDDDRNIAKLHLEQLDDCLKSSSTVLTTHARSFHNHFGHDTIIYDEDPINELVNIKSISCNELASMRNHQFAFNDKGKVNEFLRIFAVCEKGVVIKTPAIEATKDELLSELYQNTNVNSDIFGFPTSQFFLIEDIGDDKIVSYVTRKDLPDNRRVIILSATASEYIYRQLYGERLVVHRLCNVEQRGEIIQYTNRSCSRTGLDKYANAISSQIKEINHDAVITFKNYKRKFDKSDKLVHFGNCSGYDHLKGKDIVVVGTPHQDNTQYFLLGKLLGLRWSDTDAKMEMRKVEHEGMEFKFNTFNHEGLRAIHLGLIEGELLQAVGRARTVRTVAKVHVFSNFPLRIATRYIY